MFRNAARTALVLLSSSMALAACHREAPPTATGSTPFPAAQAADASALVERGAYLAVTSGCNDCHTPGYPESGGQTPLTSLAGPASHRA